MVKTNLCPLCMRFGARVKMCRIAFTETGGIGKGGGWGIMSNSNRSGFDVGPSQKRPQR
jgi:hypothetical protein